MINRVQPAASATSDTPSAVTGPAGKTRVKRSGRRAVQHVSSDFTVLMPRRAGQQVDPDANLRDIRQHARPEQRGLICKLSLTVMSAAGQGRTFHYAIGTSLWI